MATDFESTISMWVCLMLSVVLIVARLCVRRWRGQHFIRGDYWCASAAVFIIARLVADHFLVLYGSTRTLSSERRLELLNPGFGAEASKIVTGSKIVLVSRSLLICLLWSLKLAVLDLLARLISKMPYERKVMYSFWVVLLSTFIASIIAVFVSCHPFEKHWQIHPDPGECVIGNTWMVTYETSNIITDILLMALPFSLILSVHIPIMQRIRVFFLFSIGVFLIAVSIIRMILGKDSRVQHARTLWASLEILFAAIVAVTPTIYALSHNRHENSSYATHNASINMQGRTFPGSTVEDKYTARVWTELNDGANRTDSTSVEGILEGTRYEMSGARE